MRQYSGFASDKLFWYYTYVPGAVALQLYDEAACEVLVLTDQGEQLRYAFNGHLLPPVDTNPLTTVLPKYYK